MSPASTVIASSGSFWRWTTRALKALIVVLLLLWSLLLTAWLTLHWGILPHIDDWRVRIEQMASHSLGAPVRIGAIQVRSGGWIPAAELHDVVLLDRRGREALRLPRVSAALSVPSLLALQLRFEQLLIDDAQLVVRRNAAGRISIGGLEMDGQMGGEGEGNPAADWFFQQREFVMRGATLTWIDEQRGAPPLQLTDTVVLVRNGLRHHDLRIDATPDAAWGERFTLRARMNQSLVGRAGDWRHWRGTLHADLPHVDVALLRDHVALPFELREGRGALRAWLDVNDGQAGAATIDLALRDVALRLSQQVQPLQFEYLRARFEGEHGPQHARVSARRLSFATLDGVNWAESNVEASWRTAETPTGIELTAGEFGADRLDLAAMASIAARVPLGDALRKLLAELAPRGTVQDLMARWDGPLDAPRQYQARARIKGLAMAAGPAAQGVGRPGWTNADIDVQASETGGDARLVVADGTMEFPGVFEQAVVPLRRFDAQVVWRIGADRPQGRPIELRVKDARFENDDAHGEITLNWRTGEGSGVAKGGRFPGLLELHGKLADGRATSVARYLPLGLPQAARDYVQHAIQGGTVAQASFDVKGDLWEFPFFDVKTTSRDAVFRIACQAKDATFAYVPAPLGSDEPVESAWPAISRLDGEVVFERGGMTIRSAQGRIYGVDLRNVDATIRDFAHDRVLEIDGQARGPLIDMVRYVNSSPVGERLGGALAQTSVGGNAELRLALHLPLPDLAQTTVKGSVQLAGNDVRLRPDVPMLAQARGRVDFTHKSLQIVGGAARALGGDLTFEGGTLPDGNLRFNGQGVASADGLRRASELGGLTKLGAVVQGQTPYRLQIGIVKGQVELQVNSSLSGLAVNLPAPLGKAADTALPLRVQTTLQPDSLNGTATPRDQLRVDLGTTVQALYVRELTKDGPRVLRGAVGVLTQMPPAVPGVQAVAEFNLPVSLDAWRLVGASLGAGGSGAAGAAGDAGYLPRQITVRAKESVLAGRRFTASTVELQRSVRDGDDVWRANVQADQVAGTIEYREARQAGAVGQVQARLSRLWIPVADKAASPGPDASSAAAPSSVPAMDVVIDDLEWRGRKFGRVELEAVNRAGAGGASAREWRLQRLLVRTPEATLTANGQWSAVAAAAPSAQRRMALEFQLDLADSGAFLERLGYGKTLRGGKGQLQGQLAWSGSPLSLDVPSLDGQVHVALEAGQFLKADAGAARLLGVLSLQSLPRRLLLDFRDVFQEGFAFDNIGGELRLAGGVAGIHNLRMRGVQATVLMEGKADIQRETQDLRVFVVPEINAGAASLAYAAINPAIGLGTFVAQWLLRRPLIAANTREFHVTGSWDEPKVERIDRKAGDATPGQAPPVTPTQ